MNDKVWGFIYPPKGFATRSSVKERCFPKCMTFDEREKLKELAYRWLQERDTQSLAATQLMIAHWMRQSVNVAFSEYAAQWVEAQREGSLPSTGAMAEAWPFSGEYHMYSRKSHYFRQKNCRPGGLLK